MAALPYIQLYVADYLADTAHLTAAQHGAYLLLIFNYWQRGKSLNNANERLTNVVRMSNQEWADAKPILQEFFTIDGDEWRHERIEHDLASVNDKSTKAKNAGKASAEKRLSERLTDVITNVQQTLNHTEAEAEADINTPITPNGVSESDLEIPAGKETRPKKSPIVLKTFLEDCKKKGVQAIPEDDPIFKHCDEVGIPDEFITLCWHEFVDRHKENSKKYLDWKQTFRNCVRSNWFHLWAVNSEGQVFLTTQGKFAQRKYGTQTPSIEH